MRKLKHFLLSYLLLLLYAPSFSQVIRLYANGVPGAKPVKDKEEVWFDKDVDSLARMVTQPTLQVFLPEKKAATGQAVIICPGGGYHLLLTKREGTDVARAFNRAGITAFVLKYRLPSDRIMKERSVGPLQDVQQAILFVRQNARKWGINPEKIGVMGFSAGGHLAATSATHFEKAVISNPDHISLRPDFLILVYPVISFTDSIGHQGSRNNLLGVLPPNSVQEKELVRNFSNELHVTDNTPPAFIIHAADDTIVPVANAEVFYQALKQHKVPAELHIYSKGEHGFLKYPAFEEWFGRCLFWLKGINFK